MRKHEAFLRQAQSDFAVHELLLAQPSEHAPRCHALHYLQMATEKLAKAFLDRVGRPYRKRDHEVFCRMVSELAKRPDIVNALGYSDYKETHAFLMRALPLFRQVEMLCPKVAGDAAKQRGSSPDQAENVEYPWWQTSPQTGQPDWIAPADYTFAVLHTISQRTGDGASLVRLVKNLLDRFDHIP